MRALAHTIRFLSRLRRDTRGNVMILTGLMFAILLATGGMGVDLGRQQLVRIKLQQSADAAALAGALARSPSERYATAMRYFNLNFPEHYLGVERPTPEITITNTVEVTANADIDTFFVRTIGIKSTNSLGSSEVAIETRNQNYDVLLVMDNSGSMAFNDVGYTNIREMPAANIPQAHAAAINTCLADQQMKNNAAAVQYCNDFTIRSMATTGYPPYGFGLIEPTRLNALRQAATTLSNQFLSVSTHGNRVGGVTWSTGLLNSQELTEDAGTMNQFIDNMYAAGATDSTIGMQKAQDLAKDFDKDHVRVVIYLTDGPNTLAGTYDADDGMDEFGCNTQCGKFGPKCNGRNFCERTNEQTLPLCNAFKNDNVLVYVIAFGSELNSGDADAISVRNYLASCASGDAGTNLDQYFYIAPDGQTLQDAFASIYASVKKVKIIK
jgi:Flp pilus assembly protein TadG